MKRITAIALLAIANLAMAGNSFAQSKGVQADVPFDFTVGNKLLPAGTYTIKENTSGLLVIKNHDKPIAMMSLSLPDSNKSPQGGKLKFHRYGDQYFLTEILCDQENIDVRVPASKIEQRVRLQQAMLTPSIETFIATR